MFLEVYLLAIFIPYLLFAFWITRLVIKNEDTVKRKLIGGIISASIFYLIPFGDSLAGRIYLQYLCMTEGGPHIYQTVELGPEYWNEDGSAKFIYPKGHRGKNTLNIDYLGGKYNSESYDSEEKYVLGVEKSGIRIKGVNNEVYGEDINFKFSGGWIAKNSGFQVSKIMCNYNKEFFRELLNKIFIR